MERLHRVVGPLATNVHVLVADQLNTYDVLCADDIVFTQTALDAFVAGPVKADKADKENSK